jgi:hypothetical protein
MSERVCLIVDDEPAIRTYLRAILEREHVLSLEAAARAKGVLKNNLYNLAKS